MALNKVKEFSTKDFYVNILQERLDSLKYKNKNYDKCYFAFFSTSIGADFKLYPCCMTKYSKKYCIANLKKLKVDRKFFKRWSQFIKNINVKRCPTCWYDNFNSMCQYYCLGKDDFENFIN